MPALLFGTPWHLLGAAQLSLKPLPLGRVCPQFVFHVSKQAAHAVTSLRGSKAIDVKASEDVAPQGDMPFSVDNLTFKEQQSVVQKVGVHVEPTLVFVDGCLPCPFADSATGQRLDRPHFRHSTRSTVSLPSKSKGVREPSRGMC